MSSRVAFRTDAIGRIGRGLLPAREARNRSGDDADCRTLDRIDDDSVAWDQRARPPRGRFPTRGVGAIRVPCLRSDPRLVTRDPRPVIRDPRDPRPVIRDPRLVIRDPRVAIGGRSACRLRIEGQVRQQEGVRATDRRELDADERTFPAFMHKASISLQPGTGDASAPWGQPRPGAVASSERNRLQLKRQPIGNDLRARVSIDRLERAIDRGKRARHPLAVERPCQPPKRLLQVGVREALLVYAALPRSHRGLAPSTPARGDGAEARPDRRRPREPWRCRAAGAGRWSPRRAAAPRLLLRGPRRARPPLPRAPVRCCHRRQKRRRARRLTRSRVPASAPLRCRLATTSRTAAADSATGPSAGARRDAT